MNKTFACSLSALLTLAILCVSDLSAAETVQQVQLRDSSDNPAMIPDFGKKVLAIFYTDPDVADQNDTAAEAFKKENFPKTQYRGLGIANLKDAPWKPNMLIRKIIRGKEKKFNSVILTDPDYILKTKWHLGNCNELSVCIVVDKSGKIIYMHRGKMSSSEIAKAISSIKKAIK